MYDDCISSSMSIGMTLSDPGPLAIRSPSNQIEVADLVRVFLDELAELQRGNMGVAAMMVGVVLSVSLLMSGAIEQIMKWFTNVIM